MNSFILAEKRPTNEVFFDSQELMAYYEDGGTKAEEALKKIKDPSLKAFLKFELDGLKKRP